MKDLSTGEVAKLLRVSQHTVIKAIDAGVLKGYRVPCSRFRRVRREELERFAEANGLTLTKDTGTTTEGHAGD